jgi:SNF2 family DNA or RNA helicase
MLLSPKAGGVGLTLTAANHVIHLSRWWNPAVEDQCTDRVYRIGQEKAVQVHIPLAIHPRFGEHSFDENLHALLERKRVLSRGALAPPTANNEDMASLFTSSVQG